MTSVTEENARHAIPAFGTIRLQVDANASNTIDLDLSGNEGHILGRSDTKSSYIPDVDLAAFQGLDKGLSRRHAAFVRYQGQLHIVDLSSVNGTFLNDERLTPEVPYPLFMEDKLVLGEMNLMFLPT